MLRVCLLLVFVCVVGAGGLSGRGFFCRDPDTGKLYPVNTTWPSSTFCGNYHCKLRRKNLTETVYPPIRQINITRLNILGENFTRESILNETMSKKEEVEDSVMTTDKKTEPDILNDVQEILPSGKTRDNIGNNLDDMNKTERDRYLTDQEIKSISDILHTVKKSDLDAIVEIYNLAQDIYKEIDKTSTERDTNHVLNNDVYTAKTVKGTKNKPQIKNVLKNHVSYWYEPLSNSKIRPIEQLRSDLTRSEVLVRNDVNSGLPAIIPDMDVQSSNIVQVASTQSTLTRVPPPVVVSPAPRIRQMTDTYFNGPLSSKDFGKLPYYYPLSNFQRLSSYVHPPAPRMPIPIIPIPKPSFKPITYRPQYYVGGKYQKEIKPSILLPYPFSYIRHYNWSNPQNLFHRKSKIDQYEITKKVTANMNSYVNKFNNAVLMNPDLENFQDLEVKQQKRKEDHPPFRPAMMQKVKEEKRRSDWQTDPLPNHVIEEVRARVEDKTRIIKPFPLRKKVKLERVGKVIKMDDLSRSKRSFDKKSATSNDERLDERLEPELYEVYIERTTCHSDYSVPGYFRYGNLSEPFPNCCPQRIPAQ